MSYRVGIGEPIQIYAPEVNAFTSQWGVYSIPRMWRLPDRTLVVRFGGEKDDGFAERVIPNLYFRSRDEGATWEPVPDGDKHFDTAVWLGINPPYLTRKNGEIVALRAEPGRTCIDRDIPPVKKFPVPNAADIRYVYRYGDIPASAAGIEFLRYTDEAVRVTPAVMDFPEREVALPAEGLGENGLYEPMPVYTRYNIFASPYITGLTELPDGTLVGVAHGQHPAVADRQCEEVYLMASPDGGRHWTKRAVIASDTAEYPNGYAGDGCEISLTMTDNGTLVCAMRMELSITERHPCDTMLSLSKDGGYTWCKPFTAAESSVTPHVIGLRDGIVVLIYGRPGVHFKVSEDNGATWSEPYSLIGATLSDTREKGIPDGEAKYVNMESYANTFVERSGEDALLVLYNSERVFGKDGKEYHKAAFVRRIEVKKNV